MNREENVASKLEKLPKVNEYGKKRKMGVVVELILTSSNWRVQFPARSDSIPGEPLDIVLPAGEEDSALCPWKEEGCA